MNAPIRFTGTPPRILTHREQESRRIVSATKRHGLVDPKVMVSLAELSQQVGVTPTEHITIQRGLKRYLRRVLKRNWGKRTAEYRPRLKLGLQSPQGDSGTMYEGSQHTMYLGLNNFASTAIPHEIKHAKMTVDNTFAAVKIPNKFAKALTRGLLRDPFAPVMQFHEQDHLKNIGGAKNANFIIRESLRYFLNPKSGITPESDMNEHVQTLRKKIEPVLRGRNVRLDSPDVNYSLNFLMSYPLSSITPVSLLLNPDNKSDTEPAELDKRFEQIKQSALSNTKANRLLKHVTRNAPVQMWTSREDIPDVLRALFHTVTPEERIAVRAEERALRKHINDHYPKLSNRLNTLGETPIQSMHAEYFSSALEGPYDEVLLLDLLDRGHMRAMMSPLSKLSRLYGRLSRMNEKGKPVKDELLTQANDAFKLAITQLRELRQNWGGAGVISPLRGLSLLFNVNLPPDIQ